MACASWPWSAAEGRHLRPAGTAGCVGSIGAPAAGAELAILAELVGSAMLIAGARVRVVALALVPVLIGATFRHLPAGWVFNNQGGGWAFPAFWAGALLVQALPGASACAAVKKTPLARRKA
jgi:putative oxidoreductase